MKHTCVKGPLHKDMVFPGHLHDGDESRDSIRDGEDLGLAVAVEGRGRADLARRHPCRWIPEGSYITGSCPDVCVILHLIVNITDLHPTSRMMKPYNHAIFSWSDKK